MLCALYFVLCASQFTKESWTAHRGVHPHGCSAVRMPVFTTHDVFDVFDAFARKESWIPIK